MVCIQCRQVNASNSSSESDNRKRVTDIRSTDLSVTMSEIGRMVGISRQRVYQILNEEGLATKHPTKKYQYRCPECGAISTRKFCCVECKKRWQQVPVICSGCGKLFFRNQSRFLNYYRYHNDVLFCSKECTGKWLSKQFVKDYMGITREGNKSSRIKKNEKENQRDV